MALLLFESAHEILELEPSLKRPLKRRPNIGLQDRLSLNAGQKVMLQESILQYFRPSLSYHVFTAFVLSNFERPFKADFTVLIVFAQMPGINAHTGVSSGARDLIFGLSLHLRPCFVYASFRCSPMR